MDHDRRRRPVLSPRIEAYKDLFVLMLIIFVFVVIFFLVQSWQKEANEIAAPDLSKDPCKDFYEFACGNYNKGSSSSSSSLQEMFNRNLFTHIRQFRNGSYFEQPTLPKPVKQAKMLFDKCVEARSNWAKEVGQGESLKAKIDMFESIAKVPFPMLNPDQPVENFPNAETISAIMAYLEKEMPIFLTLQIGTNWADPHGPRPYLLHFDQPTLTHSNAHYTTRLWEEQKDSIQTSIFTALKEYAIFRGANELTDEQIEGVAKAMLQMEYDIAQLNTREADRKDHKRMYNVHTVETADLISPYLKFKQLVAGFLPEGMDLGRVEKFMVLEPNVTKEVMDYVISSGKVQPRTFYNYLYYRILNDNLEYLPKGPHLVRLPPNKQHFQLGLSIGPRPRPSRYIINANIIPIMDWFMLATKDEVECAQENAKLFPWANGRVYLDAKLPTKEERQKLRAHISTIVAGIVEASKTGNLAQLDWMSVETRNADKNKIDKMVINVGWPDIVEDDEGLTKFYQRLELNESMSYTQMVDVLHMEQKAREFKQLSTAKHNDREYFGESLSSVQAHYTFELNSITLYLGIMEPPFYHPNYPAWRNFGGIGEVLGHEIAHAFGQSVGLTCQRDDESIQWDETGVLRSWIDTESEVGFKKMAQCVVDEFSRFEPIKGFKIDGLMTLGENIADNGGLRAAYRAYRTHMTLNGPDKNLADQKLGMFGQDQLFFINYAQCWCEREEQEELKTHLLTDPHSPSKYRILGSVRNYPPFHAAFNCPAFGTVNGSTEEKKEHCQVWGE